MIPLTPDETEALRQLVRTGAMSLADIGLSAGIRLQLAGLAAISATHPQTVTATVQGVAFSRRGAWA